MPKRNPLCTHKENNNRIYVSFYKKRVGPLKYHLMAYSSTIYNVLSACMYIHTTDPII